MILSTLAVQASQCTQHCQDCGQSRILHEGQSCPCTLDCPTLPARAVRCCQTQQIRLRMGQRACMHHNLALVHHSDSKPCMFGVSANSVFSFSCKGCCSGPLPGNTPSEKAVMGTHCTYQSGMSRSILPWVIHCQVLITSEHLLLSCLACINHACSQVATKQRWCQMPVEKVVATPGPNCTSHSVSCVATLLNNINNFI